MKEMSKKELIQTNVGLLREIDLFCSKNNIRYSLYYGTLIGAIREKGFIPWDDDADVAMPRPDYEKFVRNYIPSDPKYKLYSIEKDRKYVLPIGRLSDDSTLKIEDSSSGYNTGIAIDIFPFDGSPLYDRKLHKFKLALCKVLFRIKGTTIKKKSRPAYQSFVVAVLKLFVLPFSLPCICRMLNNVAKEYNFEDCENVGCYLSPYKEKDVVPKKSFESFIRVEFEGCSFCAIKNFDLSLKRIYGDYMTPPPLNKRASGHDARFFWK